LSSIEVNDLLRDLQPGNPYHDRKNAVIRLARVKTSSPRVVQALLAAQKSDRSPTIRRLAEKALRAPAHQKHLRRLDPGKHMSLHRDKVLGIGLICLSIVLAPGLGLIFLREGTLPLIVLAGPAVIFFIGLLFLFTNLLETSLGIKDEIEELPRLLEDDVEALVQRRFTATHFMVVATIVAGILLLGILVWYQKWYASWGPVNVLLVSAVMIAVTLIIGLNSRWFQSRDRRTSSQVFLIPLAGLVLSVSLGLFYAEPREFGGRTRNSGLAPESERWAATRASQLYMLDDLGMVIPDFDCDDEACLVLLLIFIVIICVVASMFIPHFWVLAGHLLLAIMALMAIRELLVSEKREAP
jgi:hypothetical protein